MGASRMKIWSEECIWYMQTIGYCSKCGCVHKSMDKDLYEVEEESQCECHGDVECGYCTGVEEE